MKERVLPDLPHQESFAVMFPLLNVIFTFKPQDPGNLFLGHIPDGQAQDLLTILRKLQKVFLVEAHPEIFIFNLERLFPQLNKFLLVSYFLVLIFQVTQIFKPQMPCNGIDKGLKAAVQKKMIFFFQLPIDDNNGFLEDIFGIVGSATVGNNKMIYSRIVFLVNIL